MVVCRQDFLDENVARTSNTTDRRRGPVLLVPKALGIPSIQETSTAPTHRSISDLSLTFRTDSDRSSLK